ncbi:hypothetical protein GCM10009000_042920 [Halobacterium noricense]
MVVARQAQQNAVADLLAYSVGGVGEGRTGILRFGFDQYTDFGNVFTHEVCVFFSGANEYFVGETGAFDGFA